MFTVTAANATVGATYTASGFTFTVKATIAGATTLYTTSSSTTPPASSGTLTKASGTGDATITYSAYALTAEINAITYTAGDTLAVYGNQTLLIDATPTTAVGPININTSTTTGTLLIRNTSTTVPLVLSLNTQNSDITCTYHGNNFTIEGDWIQIHTGTGLASQTLDFNTVVGGVAIDYPPCVWVEVPNQYYFTVTAATAAVGDTYTNNGQTFTVMTAIAGGTTLYCSGTGDPATSGNLTRTAGAGTNPIVFSAYTKVSNTKYKSLSPGGVQGYFMPFFNIGVGNGSNASPDYDVQNIQLLTEFHGDLDHGPVFKYNANTKIATFGKGGATTSSLGGCVIPNGSRVLYPNIHITSSVFDATVANRNIVNATTGAICDFETVAFSRNWYFSYSVTGISTFMNVSLVGRTIIGGTIGTFTGNNIAVAPHCTGAVTDTTNFEFIGNVGDVYLDYMWTLMKTTSTYPPCFSLRQTVNIKQLGSVWAWVSDTVAVPFPIILDSVLASTDAPLTVGPFYVVGGALTCYRVNNVYINEVHHSGNCTAIATTLAANANVVTANYCLNFALGKIRKLTSGSAPRSIILSVDSASYQVGIKDILYDGQSNTAYVISIAGERIYAANSVTNNMRTYLVGNLTGTKNIRASSFMSNTAQSHGTKSSAMGYEWVLSTAGSFTGSGTYDFQPFILHWTNTSKTAGVLQAGPFTYDNKQSTITVVSGTQGVDWRISANSLYVEGVCELIFTGEWPMRGVTDFTACTWAISSTSMSTNASIEFSMRVNDGTDTSTWTSWYDAPTTGNWQTALASLSGYDSNKGFFIRYRITTTAPLTGRYFAYSRTSCTPDSTWTPAEIGFVPILVTGQVDQSTIALYDNTVPATPVLVKKQTIASTATTMNLPYDFDATAKAFKIKLRKAGYGEVISTDSSYQKGKSAPMSQVEYVAVDEVAAAAITGITVNGSGNTVTITADKTIDDIYAYLQWWGMQVANMEYEIPLVTTDGINYSSTYDWTLNGGDITGSGNLSLGAETLTVTAGETTTVPITYSSGAAVYGNITIAGLVANSRVRVNNTTDNIELYNAVVAGTSLSIPATWTADKSLDLRVTNVIGATAYLPYQATGTLTSSMASFTVTQELDVVYNINAIDGSTITYFSTDYPNLQVDISSGTTFDVQEMYAWYQYASDTSQGIVYYFNGITAQDTVNYVINTAVIDLDLDNTSGHNILMINGYLSKDDGTSYIYASTAHSIIPVYDRAYTANSDSIDRKLNTIIGEVL